MDEKVKQLIEEFPARDEITTREQAEHANRVFMRKLVEAFEGMPPVRYIDHISSRIIKSPPIIEIEGKDRVGKTTVAEALKKKFGFDVFKFPYEGVESGRRLRAVLDKEQPFEPWGFQSLMILNKSESIPLIETLGYAGGAIIWDRGHTSGKVYGTLDGIPEEWIAQFDCLVPRSDLVIILDGKGWEDDTGIYSDPVFQQRVREGYLAWFERNGGKQAVVIDADRTEEEVLADVITVISELAKSRQDYWLYKKLTGNDIND